MLNFPYLEDTTMHNDLWAWCASSFHMEILEWRIHKMVSEAKCNPSSVTGHSSVTLRHMEVGIG